MLTLLTALFPRPDNALGQYLFTGTSGVPRLPSELFGIVWWILGAWLVFRAASRLERLLGINGQAVFARLLGVLLAALAVQFVADGTLALAASHM